MVDRGRLRKILNTVLDWKFKRDFMNCGHLRPASCGKGLLKVAAQRAELTVYTLCLFINGKRLECYKNGFIRKQRSFGIFSCMNIYRLQKILGKGIPQDRRPRGQCCKHLRAKLNLAYGARTTTQWHADFRFAKKNNNMSLHVFMK